MQSRQAWKTGYSRPARISAKCASASSKGWVNIGVFHVVIVKLRSFYFRQQHRIQLKTLHGMLGTGAYRQIFRQFHGFLKMFIQRKILFDHFAATRIKITTQRKKLWQKLPIIYKIKFQVSETRFLRHVPSFQPPVSSASKLEPATRFQIERPIYKYVSSCHLTTLSSKFAYIDVLWFQRSCEILSNVAVMQLTPISPVQHSHYTRPFVRDDLKLICKTKFIVAQHYWQSRLLNLCSLFIIVDCLNTLTTTFVTLCQFIIVKQSLLFSKIAITQNENMPRSTLFIARTLIPIFGLKYLIILSLALFSSGKQNKNVLVSCQDVSWFFILTFLGFFFNFLYSASSFYSTLNPSKYPPHPPCT